MPLIHAACRRIALAAAVAGWWLLMASEAWAKTAAKTEESDSTWGKYTMAYMLVVFFAVLGLLVVCRPAKRESGMESETGEAFMPKAPGAKTAEEAKKK
jgi:heme/copper-type cytochrome/quinol oxidase subunit 2